MSKHKRLTTKQAEPAVTRGVVVAVLGLLTTLGFSWAADVSKEAIGYIVVIATVLVPVLQGMWTRVAVTANRKVIARTTTDGRVVAGDASTVPTGEELDVAPGPVTGLPAVQPVAVDPRLIA